MDLQSLAELVDSMRHSQREYFRTRAPTALEASKRLERRVDDAVKAILLPGPQRTLFESDGNPGQE